MLKRLKKKVNFAVREKHHRNAGFSLIEVIAVTIIIGVMATMIMPAIDGAGSKARNAKLKNDLSTLDQAIATYKLEQGSVPASLDNLIPDYIAQNGKGFKDAKNEDFQYSVSGSTYTLTGSDAEGNTVTSDGSAAAQSQG
ncbi:MAG: prepilin-type N-terminal cleavage/methylation domain-containing protein [Acidaminococcaceae bacterium]|nr:prepilin-type N-terminal cleavage/methylation domain-containing protein [Acidaminococcaceae bacterium]